MKFATDKGTRYLAQHFSNFLADVEEESNSYLKDIIELLVLAVNRGHVCLDLENIEEFGVDLNPELLQSTTAELMSRIKESKVVGSAGEYLPLILDDTRLYLNRYWQYEEDFINKFHRLVTIKSGIQIVNMNTLVEKYFPTKEDDPENKQAQAARSSLTKQLSIISGGPGTGKTYTAARILALILELNEGKTPNVAICAPTGKAASRLKEALQEQLFQLDFPKEVVNELSSKASTVHRLLGPIHNSVFFKHNKDNLLAQNLILIDEVSMLDVALMAKLFDAIDPVKTQVILLGDADQLASVEAGTILGDIASVAENLETKNSALSQAFTRLNLSRRYAPGSGIDELSKAVRGGDSKTAIAIVKENKADLEVLKNETLQEFHDKLNRWTKDIFEKWCQSETIQEALSSLSDFRILCGQKKGDFGIEKINYQIESHIRNYFHIPRGQRIYKGLPILILQNDYVLKLFNGDIGIIFPDETDGKLYAWFQSDDGKLRRIAPLRLPSWELCYAMTIHRSQGSEFTEVAVVLPQQDSPILSRELLYTGLSRAKKKVYLLANESILKTCINRQVIRFSGVKNKLMQKNV